MDLDTLIRMLGGFFRETGPSLKVKSAFLYGSYAYGRAHAESDVDLAVVFDPKTSPDDRFEAVVLMTRRLNTLLEKDVNILSIEEGFPMPALYYAAVVQGKTIFAEDMNQVFNIRMRAIHQMEDFSTFGLLWQRQVTERILNELRKESHA